MNPHRPAPISPVWLVKTLWSHRELIAQLTKRDVVGRYKGSVMGLMWSFVNPVLLLAMYTFVFSVVFKARWGGGELENRAHFAEMLFVGMIVHSLFSETLIRAPGLILGNVSYVKKIVFPLEILPVVAMGASVFHALASVSVLIGALIFLNGQLHWTAICLPLVLFPLVVFSLGLAWALSSLGVYLRDVAQPISLLTTILLFASPVFYPITALPENLQPWMLLNPLTFIIEQSRGVLMKGQMPDFQGLLNYFVVSSAVAWLGFAWFQKTRKGFANVL